MDEEIEDVLEELEEEYEPQVTSSDPEERKAARRLRIQRRIDNINKQDQPKEEEEEEDQDRRGLLLRQLQRSAALLQRLTLEGEEYVTNVRVANDGREVDRREVEGIGREKIYEQLEEESNAAQDIFNEISSKWTEILRYNDPLAINEDILAQKEKCDELIKQKDAILLHLKDELKTAEINFTNDQRKQAEDISTLTQRIEKQVTLMRNAYRKEFRLIEDVILLERRMLCEYNDRKWEELFKKREEEELINSKRIFEILDEFFVDQHKLRIEHEEIFRATKIRLERDIEDLQQELAKIKSLCMLNSEKLDYNYQILKKREDENIIIKSQQKRRINKLQDIIQSLTKKIAEYDETTDNEIRRLETEVKKLKKGIDDAEAKTDHFSEVNTQKYKQLMDLNIRRAVEILDKIISIDKVIHEQQLGIPWQAPNLDFLKQKCDISSLQPTLYIAKYFEKDEKEPSIRSMKLSETSLKEYDAERAAAEKLSQDIEIKKRDRLLTHILENISDKTGFLIEERLKTILKPYTQDQNMLVRVDNVFTALNIERRDDIDQLIKFFLPYAYCPICSKLVTFDEDGNNTIMQESGVGEATFVEDEEQNVNKNLTVIARQAACAVQHPEGLVEGIVARLIDSQLMDDHESVAEESVTEKTEKVTSEVSLEEIKYTCRNNHPLVITTVYVLKALKDFVTHFSEELKLKPSLSMRIEKRRQIMESIEEKNIDHYFEKIKEFVNPEREQLWDALLVGLQKYHIILKSRKEVYNDVLKLRKQNHELKHLLATYTQHHLVMDPPCAAQREEPYKKSPVEKLTKKYL